MRCAHVFETVCVHANGDVVCSIIDGRGDFVVGNVHRQSIGEIFRGPRYEDLRRLVLSTADTYCRAIGKHCPLKTVPVSAEQPPPTPRIRFLQIEPTTACDLRCLSCPVRDFDRSIGMLDAYRDGGLSFFLWDAARRAKQHAADALTAVLPRPHAVESSSRFSTLLRRGRVPRTRNGTLGLDVISRVLEEAGPDVERVDFYNYGEPFLYRHLVEALRHARRVMPSTTLAISTDGLQVRPAVEDAILGERLLDWLIFSVDGIDRESYSRYRIRGSFERAIAALSRVSAKARGTGVRVIWQYVVFRWNDRDEQLRSAIDLAGRLDVPIWFDFARSTWGRSRRKRRGLEYLTPFLRPDTDLPTWT
jgi:MoaA/NifB/PqqE/SkfB family radical SAM enzyme